MRHPGGASIEQLQNKARAGGILTRQDREAALAQKYHGAMNQSRRKAGLGFDYRERLTPQEVERYKECFTFFDREGDARMIIEDVPLALRAMGALVTGAEIKGLIEKYDEDRTGKISMEDYLNMLAEISLDLDQQR